MTLFLNKPYPFLSETFRVNIYKAIATGLFVTIFLWLFDNNRHQCLLQFADNGGIVFISQLMLLVFLSKIFLEKNGQAEVKVWHYFFWLCTAVFFGFSLMYLYVTPVYFKEPYSLAGYASYIKGNVAFLFPVMLFSIAIDYISVLKKPLQSILQAKKVNPLKAGTVINSYFVLRNELGIEIFSVLKENILFIKSADNYIEVYYHSAALVKKEMVRHQLRAVEENKENNFLLRVHRSYLCNLTKVSYVSGGIQNCTLHFKNAAVAVPVARSRARDIMHTINFRCEEAGNPPL